MMIKVILSNFVVLMLLGCTTTQTSNSKQVEKDTKQQFSASDYQKFVKDIYAGRSSIDFTSLRMAYTETADYKPFRKLESAKIEEIFLLLSEENYKACISKGDNYLKKSFASLAVHFIMYRCSRLSGDITKARFHQFVLNGLMESIGNSGDGLSLDSAYIAISADESRWYVRLLNLKIEEQDLIKERGMFFSKLTMIEPQSKERFHFYFDISAQINKGFEFVPK